MTTTAITFKHVRGDTRVAVLIDGVKSGTILHTDGRFAVGAYPSPEVQEAINAHFNLCSHPAAERYVHDFGPNGYLNVPTGRRVMCAGCGHDFGPEETCQAEDAAGRNYGMTDAEKRQLEIDLDRAERLANGARS